MVSISHETAEQAERRLRCVITQARLRVYPGSWAFEEFPPQRFPAAVRADALALVRDDAVWSQLVPSDEAGRELFGVLRLHFPQDADNSGFVGWLATHLKRRLGTGVFVVCGHNGADGGIFDYWGVPVALAEGALSAVQALMAGGDEHC